MVLYYVKPTASGGSDAAAGTSAATAWATVAKALGAAGIASGDTVYIAPGRYGEAVTVAMTTATAETKVIGDVDASEFSGMTPGPVVITAYTSGDAAAPAASPAMALAGRDWLTFEDIGFIGGSAGASPSAFGSTTTGSHHITLRRCLFWGTAPAGGRSLVFAANTPDLAFVWLVEDSIFGPGYGAGLELQASDSAGASDYDIDVIVRNCLFFAQSGNASYAVRFCGIDGGGAGAGKPGGGKVHNITSFQQLVQVTNVGGNTWSTSIPAVVYNSIGGAVSAGTSGQLLEDSNLLIGTSLRTNVTAGGASLTNASKNWIWELGQSELWGLRSRTLGTPWGTPGNVSPLLGFGSDGSVSLATDLLGRIRPAGGQSMSKAVGAIERHDTAALESTTVDAGDGYVITGPGDQDIVLLVDTSAHVVAIKARYDTNHAATNKPQVLLLANPSIGVAAESLTMSAAVDTWETLTLASITPTAKGRVILRLVSRAAAGTGKAFFDSIVVT